MTSITDVQKLLSDLQKDTNKVVNAAMKHCKKEKHQGDDNKLARCVGEFMKTLDNAYNFAKQLKATEKSTKEDYFLELASGNESLALNTSLSAAVLVLCSAFFRDSESLQMQYVQQFVADVTRLCRGEQVSNADTAETDDAEQFMNTTLFDAFHFAMVAKITSERSKEGYFLELADSGNKSTSISPAVLVLCAVFYLDKQNLLRYKLGIGKFANIVRDLCEDKTVEYASDKAYEVAAKTFMAKTLDNAYNFAKQLNATEKSTKEGYFLELAADPAHGGNITTASPAEVVLVLCAFDMGYIGGPITRSPKKEEDFCAYMPVHRDPKAAISSLGEKTMLSREVNDYVMRQNCANGKEKIWIDVKQPTFATSIWKVLDTLTKEAVKDKHYLLVLEDTVNAIVQDAEPNRDFLQKLKTALQQDNVILCYHPCEDWLNMVNKGYVDYPGSTTGN